MAKKNWRSGTTFYGCASYPTCMFSISGKAFESMQSVKPQTLI